MLRDLGRGDLLTFCIKKRKTKILENKNNMQQMLNEQLNCTRSLTFQ